MGSLDDDGGKFNRIQRNRNFDYAHAETQPFDSQFSSPSLSGEEGKGGDADELEHLQSTLPFDDNVPVEDAFETQVMNFDGETQVMNLGGETQVVNLDGETQVLDDPDCIENMDTQLLDEFDNEISIDSDGEGTDRTEVLDDSGEPSDDESVGRGSGQSLDGENILCISPRKHGEKGSIKRPDGLIDEQCSSGSSPRFTSVRAASLRTSGLAARNMTLKGTNNESCSIFTNSRFSEELTVKNNGLKPKVGEEVDQVYDMGRYNEKPKVSGNGNKCRVGCPIVRKLFTDDSLAENNSGKTVGGGGLLQLPICDGELAGLSYVDSQEPGESSQANALEFVERLIEDNQNLFDHEVDPGKTTMGKSKPVSRAIGPQSLAKKANDRITVGETRIFEWDDTREDEEGGDIFRRRKEEFFGNKIHGRRSSTQPQKLKASRLNECRDNEEQPNAHSKIVVHSDSRLVLRNLKGDDKTVEKAELTFKRNLVTEFDEQFNVNSSRGQLEANAAKTDVPEVLNVGFDTQMAAEAMEALFNGEGIANHDAKDAHIDIESNSKGSLEGSSRGRTGTGVCSKEPSSKKRVCLSDVGVATRQSKKTKQIHGKLSNESSISKQKRSKNVRKEYGMDLVITNTKGAGSNALEHLTANESGKVGKRAEGALGKSRLDEFGRSHRTATSSRGSLVKKQHLQDQVGMFTPIARRTRQSILANKLEGAENAPRNCREEMKAGALDGNRTGSTDVEASKELNTEGKSSKLGFNQSGELDNVKPSKHDPKLTSVSNDIDTLSYPRGKRSRQNLSGQVNRSNDLDAQPKSPIQSKEIGQSIAGLKRSRSKARSTSLDLTMKRKTRSWANACPVLPSSEKSVARKLSLQSLEKSGSGNDPLDCNIAGASAVKHSGRKGDYDFLASAENVEANVRLDKSPGEKCKLSDTACTTPVNCMTPVNAASPICMGDEYFKQSCKKNLSRVSLMKEIRNLSAMGPESPSGFKDLRKRRDMADVQVLFSHHLDDDIIKQQKKILGRLGVPIASSITDATHFIADEFVRTRNMLEAIASGKPVVTHLWLESVGQVKCRIDEETYILRDTKKEKEFGFSMPVSLARARQHPLLQGRRVLITPNTKPSKEIISSLVKAVHGQALERIGRSALKDEKVPDELLVLSCEEDYAICVPFLEKGAAVYSSELLLNGIVTQKLEYERHRLFAEHVKRTRSTIWLRKDDKFHPVAKHK